MKQKDLKVHIQYGKAYSFDKYDQKIIKELDFDARQTLADLAPKVGLSRDAIKYRIKRLMDQKVILGFVPTYNPPSMGYPIINYVLISLYNPNEKEETELFDFLTTNKNVTYVARLIGKWDFILGIMAKNPGEFDSILREVRHKFPQLIKDYEVYGVLQEYNYEGIGKLIYG